MAIINNVEGMKIMELEKLHKIEQATWANRSEVLRLGGCDTLYRWHHVIR